MRTIQKIKYLIIGTAIALIIDIVWSFFTIWRHMEKPNDYVIDRIKELETELEKCERTAYPLRPLYGPS